MPLIPAPYHLPALALLLTGGLIAWAAGYRLFRFVLTLFGFAIGAAAATLFFGTADRTLFLFAALGGGAIGALVMFFGYFVGVALVGAGIGALSVHMIWSRIGTDPHAFVVILASVAGAAVAMALQRYVIIVATAFAGGWTIVWAGMTVFDFGGNLARRPPVWMIYPLELSSSRLWTMALWLAVALTGVFIQLRFTGRAKAPVRVRAKPAKAKA